MYLKKVEVFGFKSFADKTVLEFEPGITAIIGPNGCGKSNISDAIRWCLGEQRAKSMRSAQMQEVIFGGSQTRQRSGMSEVSLTFDNSQNILPIEYSEVTVTRKLFRSGESEYFINKTQVRLKDIKDMFLDTGMGSDGYSIIEQGKVDFLTTARPEDRRELFEEAAGVAKYKARREETLRRLEKIDIDMSRVADSIGIFKDQIKALDIQAKKAKQYQKYKEELSKYEVAALVRDITYGISEIEKLESDLDPKFKEFEAGNTMVSQIGAEIDELRLNLDDKNEAFVALNNELSNIKSEITVCDMIVKSATERENELRNEQETLLLETQANREEVERLKEQLKNINTDDGSLAVEAQNLEKVYQDIEAQYNSVKAKLADAQIKESEMRREIETIGQQKDEAVNSKAELFETKNSLDTEAASLKRIIERLESDIEPSNNEIARLEAELSAAKESIFSIEAKKAEIDKTVLENESKINALENDLAKNKEELASIQARIETLKEFDQQDPIRSSIRAVLSLGSARGPVSSLIDADEDKEQIVASALGEKLNYLVCKTSQDAETSIKFLEENGLSRLSFIVEDKITQTPASAPLGMAHGWTELIKYLKFSNEDADIIKFVCSNALVSGSKIYGNAIVQGGSKVSFEKPVLVEEQIKKLTEKASGIVNKISSIQSEISSINDFHTNSSLEKNTLGNEIIKIKVQIDSRQAQIEEKRSDIQSYVDEISKYKEEIKSKSAELESFNDKIAVYDETLSSLEERENKLSEEIKNTESEILTVRQEEETLLPSLTQARSAWDRKSAEVSNRQQGQQFLLDNITNRERQIETAVVKTAENETKISEALTQQETETLKVQQLHEERAKKESEIQLVLNDKEALENTIEEKNEAIYELRNNVSNLNAQVNEMQVTLGTFKAQKENLEKRLLEDYEKTYDTIKDELASVEVNDEEIRRIKRKIEELGAVNHAAQEEYDALEQRYNFLVTQQQDLAKAKEDLHEVIKKINNSTIENFQKTFDVVRGNFRELYRKLFGGGEADLKLVDENNLLETGIDIFAQPPGKKLQNISLASGGEKALTAVALLFAFFMVKPSPFCILDEVDAPLDDANIGRYITMIREFAAKTQFMVVTHNKRTMEMADVLYGVTMEERGISKIISYRMKKEENIEGQEEDTVR